MLSGLIHAWRSGKKLVGHQRMNKWFPDTLFLVPHLPSHLLSFLLCDYSHVLFYEVLIIARVLTYFSLNC